MKLKWMTIALISAFGTGLAYADCDEHHMKKGGSASLQQEQEMYENDNVTRSAARGYDPERIRGDRSSRMEAEEDTSYGGWSDSEEGTVIEDDNTMLEAE